MKVPSTPSRFGPLLVLLLAATGASAQEICDNAIDDDSDGLIDLNDSTDCSCGRTIAMDNAISSIIPNPSFEEYDVLPTAPGQLDNSVAWSQYTAGTPDYFHEQAFGMPNVPSPLPDGEAYAGVIIMDVAPGWGATGPPYVEYLGAELSEPLQAGVPYTLRTHIAGGGRLVNEGSAYRTPWFGPVDITVFGYPTVGPYQFPFEYYGCPGNGIGWVELGHASYQADSVWSVLTLSFTPEVNMAALMIGGPCDPPADVILSADSAAPFFLFDDLILNRSERFSGLIVPTGAWCADDVQLTAHALPGALSYQWYFEGIALPGQTNTVLPVSDAGLTPGRYTCIARYADGTCLAMDHVLLPEARSPFVISASPRTGCEPLVVDVTCNSDVQSITWDFGDGGTANTEPAQHIYHEPGVYDLYVEYTTVAGCTYDTLMIDHITVLPTPDIDIVLDPPGPYEAGQAVQLQGVGPNADRWIWVLGDLPPYIVLNNASTTITTPDVGGEYGIVLYGSNVHLCRDTAYVTLTVKACSGANVHVPTAFSPNASGRNDVLCVYGSDCIAYMTFRIFDRWGVKVYESFDPAQCWDGLHNGQPLNPGVFVHHLHATLKNGEVVERQGNITLVR
ncbi:MAG TPA: gliding motility-associated C-terminal domain-containing protein [Flavobacteriales bacterium]